MMMAANTSTPCRRRVSTGLSLCTALLAASAAAPFAYRLLWFAELPAHFPTQSIATALILAGIAALLRRYGALAANVLVIVATGSALLSAPVAQPYSDVGIELRSQNLLGSIANPRTAADQLRIGSADVAVFQEYTPEWHAALATLRTDLPNQVVVPLPGSFGIALYTRLPILEFQQLRLGQDGTAAIAARFSAEHFTGWIVAVHLLPPMSKRWTLDRRRQLRELAEWAETTGEPVVFVGDFNDTPTSPTMRNFLDNENLRLAPPRWLPTWPARLGPGGIGIDLAIASARVRFGSRHRLPAIGSDHAGFAVTVATDE